MSTTAKAIPATQAEAAIFEKLTEMHEELVFQRVLITKLFTFAYSSALTVVTRAFLDAHSEASKDPDTYLDRFGRFEAQAREYLLEQVKKDDQTVQDLIDKLREAARRGRQQP